MFPRITLRPTNRGRIILPTKIIFAIGSLLFSAMSMATNNSPDFPQSSEVHRFVDEMVTQHGYPREQLEALLAEARFLPELEERVRKPAEALPWYRYRKIFLKPARIDAGVAFWRTHRDILERAEEVYGVPPKIIVGILGVETFFGKHKGKYPVLDSLVTLTFRNTRRTRFFRSELKQFLLLINEEGLDAHGLKGSYAGAMGLPQFISSSYRRYAVDFDGDSQRDLLDSMPDAIGSAAHYLKSHKWQRGRGIAIPVEVEKEQINHGLLMKKKGSKPHITFSVLKDHGVIAKERISDDEQVALIELETETGFSYWAGQQNFYVITRYNRSNLYAMAVYQLGEAIRERYLRGGETPQDAIP
uniref:Membrane-bound lytic murein transglycosylase B n=1 Tax=Candidatus Kentrum sp. FM TaxID=2126340 RepID=A0A450SW72_9GAMM|nr:MAG: membrane-bound lytic murein transglycosylase B [Candidatus Kentron sp. FM]VFJ58229.1 MAG: membrane-bound lytic murein transglycosylase B [Candidatus Kentron sp. FM]VFK19049.1 MAG: membrane-bound lytic murein transglycosylase B [Candidatus Kentron sp. FM]